MPTNDLDKVKKIVKDQKSVLSKKYGVTQIGIFGSFVHGDFTPKSDIDLLVEFRKTLSYFELIRLEHYLSEKLGRKVDLVPKNSLKKYIKNDILNSTIYV